MCENLDLYELDLENYRWTKLKAQPMNNDKSNLPITRDEHTCVVYDNSLVIFGGFKFGEKTNTMFRYHINSNTWEQIYASNPPSPRVGHSACYVHNNAMIIFGGKDGENNKLNDIW